ncbi:hypothetical protein Dimus_031838, partial [Dionaea muscipula]
EKEGSEAEVAEEKQAATFDHIEARSKKRHDANANDDELLSEMPRKTKKTKQVVAACEKQRQQAKRKGDSRGINPSVQKKQKVEQSKTEKKKKEKEVFFDDSDSEDDEMVITVLPSEIIMKKRVIGGKIMRENWMNENGLDDVMNLIKRQKWEKLFRRRELMHVAACKEFYANLTVYLYKKKEFVRSRVRGVEIELDNMTLASILSVLGNNGICEYIKEVWEESKYIKPLEITMKFANNELITAARRVMSTEMKLFQRFLHFVVMKNVVPRFGKRDC